MTNQQQSPSVKPDSDSQSDELHIETNKDELQPLVNPSFKGHRWVQKGPYLVCKSCPLEHATYIGMDKQLIGFDEEGLPLFKRVE